LSKYWPWTFAVRFFGSPRSISIYKSRALLTHYKCNNVKTNYKNHYTIPQQKLTIWKVFRNTQSAWVPEEQNTWAHHWSPSLQNVYYSITQTCNILNIIWIIQLFTLMLSGCFMAMILCLLPLICIGLLVRIYSLKYSQSLVNSSSVSLF
jgi:hypothetical protein